jgi:hypothetical protein
MQFLEARKPITPRGASRATVMFAWYPEGCTLVFGLQAPQRLVLQGVPHSVSTGRLLCPVSIWICYLSHYGVGGCLARGTHRVCRGAIHLSSSSFAVHLTGPATP